MHPTWRPIELRFEAAAPPANPYSNDNLRVEFEHESGSSFDVSGFWDGGPEFRARFAPPKTGTWRWKSESDVDGLDDEGSFDAVEPDGGTPLHDHGYLEADERTLRHDDGTPFFWLGDTAWAAGTRATPEEWAAYLDYRADHGYTVVQVNALRQHDGTLPHERLPFGEDWDRSEPNHEYFRTLDDLVAMAHERGIVPALVALWFDYVPGANVDWDLAADERRELTADQARALGRYLGARYGAYGAVWLVSGDSAFNEICLPVYRAAAEALGDACQRALRTAHQPGGQVTPDLLNDEPWLDFHMYQSSHTRDLERPVRQARDHRARSPPRPVLNGEPCYDGMFPDDPAERIDRETVRAAGWVSVIGGANAGVTYGAFGLWSWHREGDAFPAAEKWGTPKPWDEAMTFPSGDDFVRLRDVVTEYDVASLDPRPDLLERERAGEAAAVLSDAVFVYLAAGRAITLDPAPAIGSARWLDPATGETADATVRETDEGRSIEAPPVPGDAVLVGER